jgi:hypothetical protein
MKSSREPNRVKGVDNGCEVASKRRKLLVVLNQSDKKGEVRS